MADWEEVKRLAADFQKVQLSSTTQKLSERNCVEIVSWLIDRKLIDLIFTTDGKEYITASHLITNIQDELYIAGGRINLVELAKIIGVDLTHINNHLNEVLKNRKDIHNILGQLIDSSYVDRIAGEINEKLQQNGQISVGDLTLSYDLPADFLQHQVVEKHLGKLIFGQQDKNDAKVFFTEGFVARSKAQLRGALVGLTRPTSVASILNQIGLSEKLFFSLFDQSCMYGILSSRLPGAQYIPNCYLRSQVEWVNNFYKQNGYLEYDSLTRIGINDYKTFLKKQLPNEELFYLASVVVLKRILDRIEADIEECVSSKTYVDLQSNLPSSFTSKDISILLEKLLSGQNKQQTIVIEDFVISKSFLESLSSKCEELVKEKAKSVVESGKYQKHIIEIQGSQTKSHRSDDFEEKVDKKEERRKKAAGGKSGGGTQGRETKTKSTKKHFRGGNKNEDEDDEVAPSESKKQFEVVNESEIREILQGYLEEEGVDVLTDPLTTYLTPKLNEQGLQIAAEIFQTTVADRTASRKQTHNELQTKLNALISDVRLFEKGLKLLPADIQPQLVKYLLKTVCTDVATEILSYVAGETMSSSVPENFNNDQRLKFVNELSPEFKVPLLPLVKSLTGQSIDEFMSAAETALAACSMIIKKVDKKKDRVTVLNHKHELLEKLNHCDDLALVLHLATLIIFTTTTQCMLHASGRHISTVLTYLKSSLAEDQYTELMSYHDFVTLMLSNGSEAESAKVKLKEKVQTVKNIANEFKKVSTEKT
ncbi:E3 UFM1-protein ligase 1 homolog [Sitophilus oryzae]|uniref:E3 UFM1-protein ligase 1 homolog n=1 Tax=Sitophilus oryzae TaxID=7048 RepID=A0A6J2YG38_SITOR|nr:E3 UFM1-protein ligase 1 homolog [Sitophilus oryzae]